MKYPSYSSSERSDSAGRWVIVVFLAFLTNAALVVAGGTLWPERTEPLRERPDFRAMQLIAVDEPEPEQTPADELPQQVALPPPTVEEAPIEARFADQYERRVERETVSRDDAFGEPSAGQPGAASGAQIAARSPTDAQPAVPTRSAMATGASRERSAVPPMPERPAETSDPTMPSPRSDGASGESAVRAPESQEGLPTVAPPLNLGAFVPSFGNPGAAIAAPPTRRSDHLDLPDGERTELNSVRSMYWSFFNRMHQALEREWDPHSVFAIHDPSFQLYGQQDRYTILRVTLNSDGELRQAFIERTSGLDFYDDEAIRTFRAAAPFVNVPEGLKDENGNATFTFGFNFTFRSGNAFVRRLDGF